VPADLFAAYVAGAAGAFFAAAPASPSDRRAAVAAASRPLTAAVASCLVAQNAEYGTSQRRSQQLQALVDGAAAVVTGQQLGLFLGPLYTVFKAASAIKVARALQDETGRSVVPVFWLQNEDHDLAEIASCSLPRTQAGPLVVSVPAADSRKSIAHLVLPEEVSACVRLLEDELGRLPFAREHLDRLTRHYRPGRSWTRAFAGVLIELFEPEGLLVLDPRDPRLARETAFIHRRALESAAELARGLSERSNALTQAGFTPAVHVRAGAPLSFYHPAGADGPRCRLLAAEGGFAEHGDSNVTHSLATLLAALERDPLRFSTSALLRPIVQDSLLPTAAYVGGPGEVAYFAQLAPLYAAFDLPMPLIVPRARFRLIEPSTARLLSRHGLQAKELGDAQATLLERLARAQAPDHDHDSPDPELLERRLLDGFEQVLTTELGQSAARDPQLTAALDRTREKLHVAAAKLTQKYKRARAHADAARVQDLTRLQQALYPGGEPQERVYGLPYFAARYGERSLLERVLNAIEPFSASEQELQL
jgi:bacillithiol biosynthesis cysteine-adding enzyme BshC